MTDCDLRKLPNYKHADVLAGNKIEQQCLQNNLHAALRRMALAIFAGYLQTTDSEVALEHAMSAVHAWKRTS
jgi:hypothetical protein